MLDGTGRTSSRTCTTSSHRIASHVRRCFRAIRPDAASGFKPEDLAALSHDVYEWGTELVEVDAEVVTIQNGTLVRQGR